ncbi:hypothetical protein KQI86_07615 [Clostridium sp. MSJ-11]|uniref:Uncharacterized protein n=1 Tax=Clostridium mobile TaxID=2841512 RepID=A0ABS6EIH2_9CLOT|nr:hypothetical protein [Clostridium mobile]MBU5484194.1 hypothetical protein [Clostridium mobile]
MENTKFKRYDKMLALIFAVLTLLFLVLAFTNKSFFDWAYERHQNQLSWYLRPLFLIPFCYFAYKRSWAGIFGTIFLLLTSMFWFPRPEVVSEQVKQFLEMEKEYLSGVWGSAKILMSLLIPVSFIALGVAFWKRSLWFGLSVVVFMAVAKMIWSVAFGGEAGKSIFIPAIIGLVICIGLIYLGFRKLEKKNKW